VRRVWCTLTSLAAIVLTAGVADLHAQTICGQPVPPPASLPPPSSPPVIYLIAPCFARQGHVSVVEPQTYLYYIETRPSQPSQQVWVPYDAQAEDRLRQDFRRLWATSFLDDLTVEATDYVFANGVVGKLITFDMEERQRIRVVDYAGTHGLSRADIDEALKKENVALRLDSFLDPGALRRADTVLRRMLSEKGHLDSTVTHTITALPAGPKLVNLTFEIDPGPKYLVRDIEFVGNETVADGTLARRMKETKEQSFLSFITKSGAYKQDKFEEDADHIEAYYRDHGYLQAKVGVPDVRPIEDASDGKARYVELRIPVTEGPRYRVGTFTIADNKVVRSDALAPLFKLKAGEFYEEGAIRKGFEKAREAYGSIGHYEFTAYPEFKYVDAVSEPGHTGAPTVDVTLHMQEGEQYFINRITFVGNTVTRDKVIRREMRIVEGGVFNTEALKFSVRRLNQLGYFKPIGEGPEQQQSVQIEPAAAKKNHVDVTLKLEEHNRNELTFGAGMSGIDGLFVNGSFATTNFLGQGETFQVSVQTGARSNNYQVAFSEPYLFDRPITGGAALFTRRIDYLDTDGTVAYSEARSGFNTTGGLYVRRFTQLFTTYSYEVIDAAVRDDLEDNESPGSAGDPLFNRLLDEGRHIESRVTPSLVYNSVDSPFMPRRGMRVTGSSEFSGGMLGGTVNYYKPEVEAILYIPHTARTAFGLRGQAGWIRQYGATETLPFYRRYFLGGENQIRGVDIRTVGPLDANNRALGGNKFLLFNAEYYFDIAGPVRLLAFHDAGQAFQEGDPINLRSLRTSSGVELRVIVPVMNVPFRLIYAWNTYRDSFQPPRGFRFAIGTTF
jgi:outer membrane protein insertion porin family